MAISIFSGNAGLHLATQISDLLQIPLGKALIARYPNSETYIKIFDDLRNKDIFIVQSLCAPVNDNLMELLLLVSALSRSGAKHITVIIPYFAYARQPQHVAALAQIFASIGINRIITLDLHDLEIIKYFKIPVLNLSASFLFVNYMQHKLRNALIVAPDQGARDRAIEFANLFNNAEILFVDKQRHAEFLKVRINKSVAHRDCVIVDDMVDTGATLLAVTKLLKINNANDVFACCTHGILSGDAVTLIQNSALAQLIITDSVRNNECTGKIEQVSIAELLSTIIYKH